MTTHKLRDPKIYLLNNKYFKTISFANIKCNLVVFCIDTIQMLKYKKPKALQGSNCVSAKDMMNIRVKYAYAKKHMHLISTGSII